MSRSWTMHLVPDASPGLRVTSQTGDRSEEMDTLTGSPRPKAPPDPIEPNKRDPSWPFDLGSLWSKPSVSRATLALIMLAQLLGWVPGLRASSPPVAPSPAPPDPDGLVAVRRALREMDRFLDHHPLLEDRLRLEPELARAPAFLEKNPELREFLEKNPDAAAGLKIYPRYFLYRALLREASGPLSYTEVAQLKELLTEDPALEKELRAHPESIGDSAFLKTHQPLLQFLQRHPTLARVFIHKVNTP